MTKLSHRAKAIAEVQPEEGVVLSVKEAITRLKDFKRQPKFNQSVDVAARLGVDVRKSDQNVRGATVLPNGTGRTQRVAVFAEGENAEKALKAGADIVGMDDLVEKVQKGELEFDLVIATPRAMPKVGKLGQILGPRGLMPNPKLGTVTDDVEKAVNDAKRGQIQYRTEKNGIVHCTIGKLDFEATALEENLVALLDALQRSKPSGAKGVYFKQVVLSTTMGPGFTVDHGALV